MCKWGERIGEGEGYIVEEIMTSSTTQDTYKAVSPDPSVCSDRLSWSTTSPLADIGR